MIGQSQPAGPHVNDGRSFTSADAHAVLDRVCQEIGANPAGAKLLRFGENAIFRLSGPFSSTIVRIARDMTRLPVARRELCGSRWLNDAQVPATQVLEQVDDQPRVIDGHPVTFWWAVEGNGQPPTVADLGCLLRKLHALSDSPCHLPELDPLSTVRSRLAHGLELAPADLDFLAARCEQVQQEYCRVEPVLPLGPIYGDAHTGNLLGKAGEAVLIDLETFAFGPREWDLIPVTVGHARLGISKAQLDGFNAVYGFDVRYWSGYSVLRQARELGMVTWLAQNVGESPRIAAEVAVRIDSLRRGDYDARWVAF